MTSFLRRVFGRPRPPARSSDTEAVTEKAIESEPCPDTSSTSSVGTFERRRQLAKIEWLECHQREMEERLKPYEALKEIRQRG